MYVSQLYTSWAGGDTAGLSIDRFDPQRATFRWDVHIGSLELLNIHRLQRHNQSQLRTVARWCDVTRNHISCVHFYLAHCCPLTAAECKCDAVLTPSPPVLMSTSPWIVPTPVTCPPWDLTSIWWPWETTWVRGRKLQSSFQKVFCTSKHFVLIRW